MPVIPSRYLKVPIELEKSQCQCRHSLYEGSYYSSSYYGDLVPHVDHISFISVLTDIFTDGFKVLVVDGLQVGDDGLGHGDCWSTAAGVHVVL